jgi:hypothetical protein
MRNFYLRHEEKKLTEGKAPPHATGLIVSRSHCFRPTREKGNSMSS